MRFHNLFFPQTTKKINIALRKHVLAIYCNISRLKKKNNFQVKNCDIFLIFAQNIDCGHTVRTASVPTIYVLEQNKKIMYTPVNPSFTIYTWGVRGVFVHGHVFVMA